MNRYLKNLLLLNKEVTNYRFNLLNHQVKNINDMEIHFNNISKYFLDSILIDSENIQLVNLLFSYINSYTENKETNNFNLIRYETNKLLDSVINLSSLEIGNIYK